MLEKAEKLMCRIDRALCDAGAKTAKIDVSIDDIYAIKELYNLISRYELNIRKIHELLEKQESVKPEKEEIKSKVTLYKCSNCGASLLPGNKYCNSCGKMVEWDA